MINLHILYQLQRADFLERVRRRSFLIVLGAGVLLGYLSVPADNANYNVLVMSGFRGVYNSAWIGLMVAIVSSTFLTLPGFYLVKNSITRDIETGVGQIIATTPISRRLYMFGKFLSNFSVLTLMVAVMSVTSLAMQFMRGESYHVDLWQLLAPFIFIALPSMAVVAAIALLFESISWLRGGAGNMVWFFVWLAVTIQGMAMNSSDLLGISRVVGILTRQTADLLGRDSVGITIASFVDHEETGTFVWGGLNWNSLLLERLFWVTVAVVIVFIASMLFHRFDPSRKQKGSDKSGLEAGLTGSETHVELPEVKPVVPDFKFSFFRLVILELRIMFRGVRWWWYLIAAGLWGAALLTSIEGVPNLLVMSWLWPVLMWSPLGNREAKYGAQELVFSSPHLLSRQLSALWISGFLLAVITGSGVLFRMAVSGNWPLFLSLLVGAAFIPSLALALGVWTRSSKLFEIVFISIFWYIGLLTSVPLFDFAGLYGADQSHTFAYLLMTASLCVLAVIGRKRQLQKI